MTHGINEHGPGRRSPLFELTLEPNLEQISAIREFVESYFLPLVRDADLLCRITVAAHELLENAAKYSAGGTLCLRIEVRRGGGADAVVVSVQNIAAPMHLVDLRTIVAELTDVDDVGALYQRYLVRASRRKEGSGLGLARIRAEAEMTLAVELKGNLVCVEAVARLAPEGVA